MSSAEICEMLEGRGWTRAVAGDADFDAAVAAIGAMHSSPGLGLIVAGEYGVGKTALVDALTKGRDVFKVRLGVSTERLTPDWQEYWAVNPYAQDVWLDDLGAERQVNDFGVRLDTCADFIVRWHELRVPTARLFITTNFTTAEMDARYGGRVLSRLKDLCVPLRLGGKDKRQWQKTKGG